VTAEPEAIGESAWPTADPPPTMIPTDPPPTPKRRRRVGWIITVVLLSLALLAVVGYLLLVLTRLDAANTTIEEQEEIIDSKEIFSAAMQDLVDTAARFEGSRFVTLVPDRQMASIAERAWDARWNLERVDDQTRAARDLTTELEGVLEAATAQSSANASASAAEGVVDTLGAGFLATVFDDADTLCEREVLGCVRSDDPYTIHFDTADLGLPYMNDWLWTGIAYHEVAHALQFANPQTTADAAEAFGGDWETMADCFALTLLPGWALDQEVWVSRVEYWEVSLGYGYTCDETQRQVIRDWYDASVYHAEPIAQ